MTKNEIENLIENKIDSCRIDIHTQIKEIQEELSKQKSIRKGMEETLVETLKQSKINHKAFREHDKDEMEKYDQVISSITELTETMQKLIDETSKNTNYVTEKQQKEEVDRRVDAIISEEKRPGDEAWDKIKMTALTVITVGIMGALATGAYFVFELYVTLGLNKE